jgi:peptidoglycan LD-endopeptidase LytH
MADDGNHRLLRPVLSFTMVLNRIRVWLTAVLLVPVASGCDNLRRAAEELLDQREPRQRYVDALKNAGLGETALTADWVAAGDRALHDAPLVSSPHEEQGFLTPAEPSAIALRVRVRRGQELSLEMDLPGDTTTTLFLDAWAVGEDSLETLDHLASADSGERLIRVSPRRDGEVIVRAQPELLRGGRFRALVRVSPTLAFPVSPGTDRDIGSRFGAPRDAGARSHHGIDIFAKRGTPVVAAAAGVVNRVNETNIGGKVIWVRDTRGNSLYYAHLDSQAVSTGMRVEVGDVLGFVGNTGNARSTPPHLHFGVYRRGEGPVDPYWFVYRPRGAPPRLVADTTRLGRWIRPSVARATLRRAPSTTADTIGQLGPHSAMRVLSAAGEWYRVRMPDGATGFISARLTEPAESAIATLPAGSTILDRPAATHGPSNVVAVVTERDTVGVVGRFGEFVLVRSNRGIAGWVLQN